MTLIELIVVLALLATVLAVAAPSLSRFFRGRHLDSEARRFLALTRYGQSRAVSEGVPMVLWIDAEARTYGLEADQSFVENDSKAEEFSLAEKLEVEVELPVSEKSSGQWWQNLSGVNNLSSPLANNQRDNAAANLPQIRFQPDGFIGENSLERVLIREAADNGQLGIARSRNGLSYEIQTNILHRARR